MPIADSIGYKVNRCAQKEGRRCFSTEQEIQTLNISSSHQRTESTNASHRQDDEQLLTWFRALRRTRHPSVLHRCTPPIHASNTARQSSQLSQKLACAC